MIAIDVETTGVDWTTDRVFGVAIAWIENGEIKSDYFDVRRDPVRYQELKKYKDTLIVNHNIKFDMHMLLNDGIELRNCECTMVRAALIDEHRRDYSLDALAKDYLNEAKVSDIYEELAERFGGRATRNAQMPNLQHAPPEIVAPYAKKDAELALRLYIAQQDLLPPVWELEKRLFPYIFRMEREGVRVDLEEAEHRQQMLNPQIAQMQKQLDQIAGFTVNPNPSKSIHELFDPKKGADGLWRACDGTILPETPAGKPSIGSASLQIMKHPAARLIIQIRKLTKTRDTFIGSHIMGHARGDRVHPNINQTKSDGEGGTGTGRLSYTKPALQQIPSRDKEIAKIVRPIFIPDDSMGWSYGDLDQHELRIFHHYVNNPEIVQAYIDNPDLDGHGAVSELTGLPRNPPPEGGANAKQMNLAMVFNMGGGELAAAMGLPYTTDTWHGREIKVAGPEAQKIIDDYYQMIPGVKEIAQKARSIAKSRGYVRTLMGRHIRFPGGEFTHKASGLIYQGTAGDLNKDNICRIFEYLDAECPDARLLLNIHDEYSISLPFGGASKHLRAIKEEIQRRPEIRVPLRIDFSEPQSNWWDATCAPIITGE